MTRYPEALTYRVHVTASRGGKRRILDEVKIYQTIMHLLQISRGFSIVSFNVSGTKTLKIA
jgi:hypothetical protein